MTRPLKPIVKAVRKGQRTMKRFAEFVAKTEKKMSPAERAIIEAYAAPIRAMADVISAGAPISELSGDALTARAEDVYGIKRDEMTKERLRAAVHEKHKAGL